MEQNSHKQNKFSKFDEHLTPLQVNEPNHSVGNKENNPYCFNEFFNENCKTKEKSHLDYTENCKKSEYKSDLKSKKITKKNETASVELFVTNITNQELDLNVKNDYINNSENSHLIMESTEITYISPLNTTPLRRETYSLNKKYSNVPLEAIPLTTNTNVTIFHSDSTDFNPDVLQFDLNSVHCNGNYLNSTKFNNVDNDEHLNLQETFNSHSHYNYDRESRLADKLNSDSFQFTPVTVKRQKSEIISKPSELTTVTKNENKDVFLNTKSDVQNEITLSSESVIFPRNLTDQLNSTEFCLTPVNSNENKQEYMNYTPSFLKSETPQFEIKLTYEHIKSPLNFNVNDKTYLDSLKYISNKDDHEIELNNENENLKDSEPNFIFSTHSTPATNNTFDVSKSDSFSKISTGSYVKEDLCEQKQNISSVEKKEDLYAQKHNDACPMRSNGIKKNVSEYNYELNYSGKAVKNIIEANLWASPLNLTFDKSPINNQRHLSCINEEETHIVLSNDTNNYSDSLSDKSSTKSVNMVNENDDAIKNKIRFYDSIEDFESIPCDLMPVKRKADSVFRISPPKRIIIHKELKSPRKESWSKLVLKGNISHLKQNFDSYSKLKTKKKKVIEKPLTLYDPNLFLKNVINPDPFAASMTIDPFLSNNFYYDEIWIEKQEIEFKKWLNALLTPPAELDCESQNIKIDIAKLWEECRKKDLKIAPTKENVSSKYHVNNRLNSLRRAACNLIKSEQIIDVFSKITVLIEKKHLVIRNDRDLHLDVGLQAVIMKLILCYNPLWLRIGLEAVYGETIPLNSNSDVIGLSTFIMLHLFRDPFILKKHSNNVYLAAYTNDIKKFTLKKFLMLVFFLDYAKRNRLIKHDPCLFCPNALIKDSREILLSFTRELLSGVGDITKFLRNTGYIVSYKQSILDEFDYAVKNLAIDLRDGVRLARISEIILMKNDLLKKLRVPAISRLQKIHNVKVALGSLVQSGFEIHGDILPKDIADGHREKTLSLLWQLIYKFRSPRFVKATELIQKWWRSMKVVINRRILKKKWEEKVFYMKTKATVILQKHFRAYLSMKSERLKFKQIKHAIIIIQKWFRNIKVMRQIRSEYLIKLNAIIIIQRFWRSCVIMKNVQKQYIRVKNATVVIQRWYKRIFITNKFVPFERIVFLKTKQSTLLIQDWFRRCLLMKKHQEEYLRTLNAVKKLQIYFKATLIMKRHREEYKKIKNAASILQKYFRATIVAKKQHEKYLEIRKSVLIIQTHFRATLKMRKQMNNYVQIKKSVCIIQQYFRATILMKNQREEFLNLRKVTIICQRYFRATLAMKKERNKFLQKKKAAIIIQKYYRSTILAKKQQNEYLNIKKAIHIIQYHTKAYLVMKKQRIEYLTTQNAIRIIQSYFRATLAMKRQRSDYLKIKAATIIIQQRFRAYKMMQIQRIEFLNIKEATIIIQNYFKANLAMKRQREIFLNKRNAAVVLQRSFKATLLMKKTRLDYLKKINAVKIIQSRYRAIHIMKKEREKYLKTLRAVKIIEEYMFATIIMRKERLEYLKILKSVRLIQIRFKAYRLMIKQRKEFLIKLNAISVIQSFFRAYLEMKKQKYKYMKILEAAKTIQMYFKATLAMKEQRKQYLQIVMAAQTIQIHFRAMTVRNKYRNEFLSKKRAVCILQSYFRGILLVKKQRNEYLRILNATYIIQNWYRSILIMKRCRISYLKILNATKVIQNRLIATLIMRKIRRDYLLIHQSTIILQSHFRATLLMRKQRNEYLKIIKAVKIIQVRFRANMMMKKQRAEYLRLIKVANVIQFWFRNNKLKQEKIIFIQKVNAAKVIQRYYRQYRLGNSKEVQKRRRINSAASVIQAVWKGYRVRRDADESKTKMRKRLQELSDKSDSGQTIAERYNSALNQLKSTESMLEIIEAIMILDTLTCIYPKICVNSCPELVHFLYLILSSSNRSVPHEKACNYSVCVLINLVKFPETKIFIWKPDHIDTLLTLMLRWCDKEGPLFPYLCTLVWLLCQDPDKASIFAKHPQTEQKLNKIFVKTKRLQTMLDNKNKKSVLKKTYKLPAVVFDWKVVENKRPRTFDDALYGIRNVIKVLNLNI